MGGTSWSDVDPTNWSVGGVKPYSTGSHGVGKGGKNGGPQAPDFAAAAETQARTSRNDVSGTFGGAKWSQTPDGRWSLDMSMSPELQGAAQNAMGRIQNTPDAGAARDQAIDSAYRMQTSRLDPQYQQAQSSLENQLANEGYSRGDEGYSKAMDNFGRQRTDAYQQALLGAQSGAGNTAYAQTLASAMQPYQQLQAIRGLGEGTGLAALGQAQPVNSLAAASALYNGQLQNYGIQQQGKNSMMGGIAGLGTAAIMAG